MLASGEQESQFLSKLVTNSAHGIFAVDTSGTIVFSNGVVEELLGLSAEAFLRSSLAERTAAQGVLTRVREAAQGEQVELPLETAEGETITLLATSDRVVVDGTEYVALWCRERVSEQGASVVDDKPRVPVESLLTRENDLFRVSNETAVAENGLTLVQECLETDVGCLTLYDEETTEFERVATTERAAELLETRPTFDLNRSLAGRAFRRDEPVVDRPETVDDDDVLDRPNLHVPIGDKGVLTVFGPVGKLGPRAVELATKLADLIAAALGRVDGSDSGQSGGYRLPMRNVLTRAVQEDTEATIGQQVCEQLADTEWFDGAWFVRTAIDGEWRELTAAVGGARPPEDLERAATSADRNDPVTRAAETDDICVVDRQQTVRNEKGVGTAVRSESVEQTLIVPVSHVDSTFGVLVLQADSSLDGQVRSELDLLGDILGLASYATENKKLLLAERVQELEFEVTDPSCLAVAVSEATDSFCEVEHRTLTNDGDHLCFFRVENSDPDRTRKAVANAATVTDCSVIDANDDECLLEVVKTESGAEAMMDVGGTVRHATADSGVGRLVVETPLSADVREVVDAYTSINPDSHLVAKREINRKVPTVGALTDDFESELTEKQHAVLTTAYYAGYFEWPRANTAEEVAESLDLSPATFHEHLRTAEQKLVSLICTEQTQFCD